MLRHHIIVIGQKVLIQLIIQTSALYQLHVDKINDILQASLVLTDGSWQSSNSYIFVIQQRYTYRPHPCRTLSTILQIPDIVNTIIVHWQNVV